MAVSQERQGNERVQATYRGNYSRLREPKHTYDPKDVFRINQNIPPAGCTRRRTP
jgi:hypothetical protein